MISSTHLTAFVKRKKYFIFLAWFKGLKNLTLVTDALNFLSGMI